MHYTFVKYFTVTIQVCNKIWLINYFRLMNLHDFFRDLQKQDKHFYSQTELIRNILKKFKN